MKVDRPAAARDFVRASRGARTFPGVPEENYWFRRHEATYRLALRVLGPRRRRILDVGCGEGYGSDVLRRAGPVVSVELDAAASAWATSAYPGSTVVRADACRLPFRPGSFDAVVALQLAEHLYCPGEFVAAAARLLGPGGILLVTTPNRETSSPDGEPNPFHVHEYTASELSGLLGTGFRRVRTAGIHPAAGLAVLGAAAGGSLHLRLARTPFSQLPGWLRLGVRAVRARHFRVGGTDGSLDLVAVAGHPFQPR